MQHLLWGQFCPTAEARPCWGCFSIPHELWGFPVWLERSCTVSLLLWLPSTDSFSHLNGFPPGFWYFPHTYMCQSILCWTFKGDSLHICRILLSVSFCFLWYPVWQILLRFSVPPHQLLEVCKLLPETFSLIGNLEISQDSKQGQFVGLTSFLSHLLRISALYWLCALFVVWVGGKIWFVIPFILHGNESLLLSL